MSRSANDNTTGKKDFENTDPASGASIFNGQREWNKLNSFLGSSPNTAEDSLPSWTNNDVGASTDDVKTRADNLTQKFNDTTGHTHDGTPGNGGSVSAVNLNNFNNYFAEFQTNTFAAASGNSTDVSSLFSLETPGGGTSTYGVVTTAPYNRVELKTDPAGDFIETGSSEKVYARLTESSGTWTLTYYYVDSGGTETAYSLPSQDIRLFYKKVFDAETRPTFPSDLGDIGSFDATADIIDATASEPGRVSTTTQTFGGRKTFANGADFSEAISTAKTDVSGGGTINALTSTYSFVKITGTGATTLNGITAPSVARRIVINNDTDSDITINDEAGAASASDRFTLADATAIALVPFASAEFIYDLSDARWKAVSSGASGSATGTGGSVAINWIEDAAAPIASTEYNNRVYLYEFAQSQDLWSLIKIPASYSPGTQIFLRTLVYSPDSSGDILMKSQTTLYRTGVDALSSSANQNTSTNTAITLSGGTVDEPQALDLDLTDAVGEINGVAVSPGDSIKIRLYRDTDTATSDVRALVYASEATFS